MQTEAPQGSPEWFAARLGRVTASRVSDVIAKTKTGWGASRANYAAQLVAERLTGEPGDKYTNAAMQWGTDTEPHARAAYEFMHGADVQLVGFIPHPKIEMAGASPDGLVEADGLVEIKCPNTATHIETLLGGSVPGKYQAQMQFQLACTGRQWCDFVSFDPRLPESMRLFVRRLNRDEEYITGLEVMIVEFLGEVDSTIRKLKQAYGRRPELTAADYMAAG
jgi:putative phage-type endonuclease